VPSYVQAIEAIPSRLTNEQFRAIMASEAQCRAAEYAPVAYLLLSENDATAANAMCDPDSECSEPLKRDLQEMRAVDERNKAAANALRAFYRLAEAEAGLDGIDRSLPLLDRAIADARKIREQGITLTFDDSALERQRFETLDKREDVQLAILQLNERLAQLLGVDRPEEVRFWPQVEWSITTEPLQMGTLVAQGMDQRADLAMLRRAQDGLNASTVSAARQLLAMTDVAMGQASPISVFLFHDNHCECAACEELVRRRQLEQLTRHQEETAASEIRQAVHGVETRARQAALAGDTLKSWRKRLDDARTLRRNDRATQFDVYTAELSVINAETELLRQIVELRIAEVELKAAQGLLAVECGYSVNNFGY
jgi:outer membrane protein TolC